MDSFSQDNAIKYLSTYQSALGSNTTVLSGINALHGNPASTADEERSYVLTINTEQRYLLSSLNSSFIGGIFRIGSHDYMGVSYANFGIDEFQEQKIGLSYSRKIAKRLFIGTNANYYNFRIEEYGNRSSFDMSIGVKSSLGKSINFGLVAENVIPASAKSASRNNTTISAGIQYKLSEKVLFVIESKTDFSEFTSWSFGIHYDIINELSILAGINGIERGPSFGLNYKINPNFLITGAIRSSQNLGTTPSLGITYYSSR